MKPLQKIILPLALLLSGMAFTACETITGTEIGRMTLNDISNDTVVDAETTLDLKTGEIISFWTETDMEYDGEPALSYLVEVFKDSIRLGDFTLDAMEVNPTLMETKVTHNDHTKWQYTGKMDEITIEEDGSYRFRAALFSSDEAQLKIKRAELILRK